MVAVEADAEEAIERMAVLVAQALEASLDLVNDFLGSGRIRLGANAIGGAFGVLVLDDYPRVDRIGPALGHRELVFHLQLDSRFFLDEGELLLDLHLDFLFVVGELGGIAHVLRELRRFAGDQLIERLGFRHRAPRGDPWVMVLYARARRDSRRSQPQEKNKPACDPADTPSPSPPRDARGVTTCRYKHHTRGSGRSSRYAVPVAADQQRLQAPHPRLRPVQQIRRPCRRGGR